MMGDLWTFGDSFSASSNSSEWFNLLIGDFKGTSWYNNFCDSRDVQTIMDTFYRNLCNIKENSLVVIFLPTLARIRYPKKEVHFDKIFESSYLCVHGGEENMDNIEYFSHWPYREFPKGTPRKELDFPFDYLDLVKIDNKLVSYVYNNQEEQKEFRRLLQDDIDSIKPVDFAKLLKTNKANVENWNSIFESLKKFCKFNLIFVSWTDEYNSKNVFGKKELTEEIGMWHTKHDEFNETNGKSGLEWDEHFSTQMNKEFSKWIKNKYPNYFNI